MAGLRAQETAVDKCKECQGMKPEIENRRHGFYKIKLPAVRMMGPPYRPRSAVSIPYQPSA